MNLLRVIVAVLGGLLAAFLIVMSLQFVSSLIYPMPTDLDLQDQSAVSEWIRSLPLGAVLLVLFSEACGYFAGPFLARRFAPERTATAGLIVWGLLLVASIANLVMIPHPIWFALVSLLSWFVLGGFGLIAAAPANCVVRCSRTISAPLETVFRTLASIEHFSKAVPGITKVEFLTDSHYGVGTRFRETRLMNGKEASTELEVTELVENQHIRIVSDAGGTIWDTVFRVRPAGNQVQMDMQMDARPHKLAARVMTPLIIGMVGKFVAQDMDSVKSFCEKVSKESA